MKYDEYDECATSNATAQLTFHSQDALINKFLDRFAEVFCRGKSFPQHSTQQGSKHIAAAAWIEAEAESPVTILVAKNEGLDDRDHKMSSQLQLRLRTVAATGRHSPVTTDMMWHGQMGLVEYSRGRLSCHIYLVNQLDQAIQKLATQSRVYGPVITGLQYLCRNATKEPTVRQLSDIVNVSFVLRNFERDLTANGENKKALRSVYMLGRLRAAYECFKSVALSLEEISTIEMKAIEPHDPVEVDINAFRQSVQQLAKIAKMSKDLRKARADLHGLKALRLHIHAEMQILVNLAKNPNWHRRAHSYIGTSKRPCFLCQEMLRNYIILSVKGVRQPSFGARQSHRKIYPLWTLPRNDVQSLVTSVAMATAVKDVYLRIQHLLEGELNLQPAVAESSAGVTVLASVPDRLTSTQKQHLANQRSSKLSAIAEEESIVSRTKDQDGSGRPSSSRWIEAETGSGGLPSLTV